MIERRRFYRINDSVVLNYQAFPEENLDEAISRLKMLSSQHQILQNSLGSLEHRLDFLLEEISEPLPEIAEALKLINRKLSILGNIENIDAGITNEEEEDSVLHEINLSGSGIAFTSPSDFLIGETMEIEFVLFPSYNNVKAIGKVVDCRRASKPDSENEYEIAVDFVYLRESDQEFIVAHILSKQSELLKMQREINNAMESTSQVVA